MTTLHTYSDLLHDGGRLAATRWETNSAADAVEATLRYDDQAIILSVAVDGRRIITGHAPGGIA